MFCDRMKVQQNLLVCQDDEPRSGLYVEASAKI